MFKLCRGAVYFRGNRRDIEPFRNETRFLVAPLEREVEKISFPFFVRLTLRFYPHINLDIQQLTQIFMKYNLRKVEKVKKRERPGECTL